MSNSDIHTPMVQYPGQYRAMTLVLAKERSEKGIQEALVDHRTIACMDGQLFGKSEWVKPLVENSLIVKSRQINDKSASLEIENISGIAYQLVVLDSPGIKLRLNSHLNIFTIDAFSQNAITVSSSKFVKGEEYSVKLNVLNVQVAAGKPLEYVIKFRL